MVEQRLGESDAELLRITRDLSELLDEQAAALGRDPRTITRSVVGGYEWTAPSATPWVSAGAFEEFVGRYREIGFSEFITREPGTEDWPVLEQVATDVLPTLRGE